MASRRVPREDPTAPTPAPVEAASPAVTTVVPVAGMTCRACERRIEREVRRLPGVRSATASAPRGRVEIVSSGALAEADLAAAVESAGYRVGATPWLTRDPRAWLAAAGGLALVIAVAAAAGASGLLEAANGLGSIDEGGLVVAGLLGLAAGVSTCMALTGGLVLALSASFAAARPPDPAAGVAIRLRPTVVFLGGRIVGFALLGAALGAVGSAVVMPPLVVAALMIAVAVVMTVVGVRLTGLSPRVAAWSPTLPGGLGRSLGLDDGAVRRYSDTKAALLGAATFFLPCGFTQAVQVYALSTGSPFVAGAIMAIFALGTAPGLLALGGLPSLVPARWQVPALRLVGVVVLGFAVINAAGALRLAGLSPAVGGGDAVAGAPRVTVEGGVQTLRTYQVATGYLPADAAIYADMPTRWIVESLEPQSCAVFLVVPGLGISVTLQAGENAIDLPPLAPGTVDYTCSMGMYGGRLTVVEQPQSGVPAPGG